MELLRQGAPAILWSLVATLVFLVATWAWKNRGETRGRLAGGLAMLVVTVVVALTLWDYLPRPSFAFITAQVAAWVPFVLGVGVGLLLAPRVRTFDRWARSLKQGAPPMPPPPVPHARVQLEALSVDSALLAFESLQPEEQLVLKFMWGKVNRVLTSEDRNQIAHRYGPPHWHLMKAHLLKTGLVGESKWVGSELLFTPTGEAVMLALTERELEAKRAKAAPRIRLPSPPDGRGSEPV